MAGRSKGFTHGEAPPTPRYLIVQLKPGWHADFAANAFVSGRRRLLLDEVLATKVSLQPHVATLAGKAVRTMSKQERELARFVQVRAGSQKEIQKVAQQLSGVDGVEQVVMSAEVALPTSSFQY